MLLLIDNYDSFVHNLARYFRRLGQETLVLRNDAVDVAGARALGPSAIVFSPGPCTPREAGNSLSLVRELHDTVPMLGVCLGHQVIAAALGGEVVRAPEPMHGRASRIVHQGSGLFAKVANPLHVGRYHSLVVQESSLPKTLEVTARTDDGVVMAFRHQQFPVFGVQFHPESVLTQQGFQLLANFLHHASGGRIQPPTVPAEAKPISGRPTRPLPNQPLTF